MRLKKRELNIFARKHSSKIWTFFFIFLSLIFLIFSVTFHKDFSFEIDLSNKTNLLFLSLSVFLAFFAMGFSSSTIQYSSKNILASPLTIGIFPAASFSYLILYILGMPSNFYYKFLLNFALTFLIMMIYFLIDFKLKNNSKIVFAFILSITLSSVSLIIFTRFGIIKEATLLFAIDKLNMSLDKLILGIGPILLGMIIILIIGKKLNLIYFDALRAKSMGINVNLIKFLAMMGAILAINGSLIIFGVVSFVGLIIPNVVRIMGQNKFYSNFWISALFCGAVGIMTYFFSRFFKIEMFLMLIILIFPLIIPIIYKIKKIGQYG